MANPQAFRLIATHDDTVAPGVLARAYADVLGRRNARLSCGRGHVEVKGPPTRTGLLELVEVARAATGILGFEHARLVRDGQALSFVPPSPLGGACHLMIVTPAHVAAHYEEPAEFWRVWDSIERIGALRLCLRHLDAVADEDWLSFTYTTRWISRGAQVRA